MTVTLRDLGGGPFSDGQTYLEMTDSHGSYIYSTSLSAERFDYDNFAVTLTAGKYYLPGQFHSGRYGDNYSITTGGTDGAFGAYAPIAAQCAAATASVAAVQAELLKSETRLKNAGAGCCGRATTAPPGEAESPRRLCRRQDRGRDQQRIAQGRDEDPAALVLHPRLGVVPLLVLL